MATIHYFHPISEQLRYDFSTEAKAMEMSFETTRLNSLFYINPRPTLFQRIRSRSFCLETACASVAFVVHDVAMTGIYVAGSVYESGRKRSEMWHYAKRSLFHAAVSGACAITNAVGVISPHRGAQLYFKLDGWIDEHAPDIHYLLSPIYERGAPLTPARVGTG